MLFRSKFKAEHDALKKIYKDNLTNDESLQLENKLISELGRADLCEGVLFNKTNGGEVSSGRIVSDKERYDKSVWMKSNSPSLTDVVKRKLSILAKERFIDKTKHSRYFKVALFVE